MFVMDTRRFMLQLILLSMIFIKESISDSSTSDFTIYSFMDCKDLTVDKDGTIIKWEGASLSSCKMNINKQNWLDDEICVTMQEVDLQDIDNKVEFRTTFSVKQSWSKYSSGSYSSTKCSSSSFLYIEIDTDNTPGGSFQLKVYSKDTSSAEVDSFVKTTVMTIGAIIGIIFGVIVLLIIVIIVVVCCCCMKGRRSQGHVYRQTQAPTATVVTQQQHPMVAPGQPQPAYPAQPMYPPQQQTGYPAQVTGYTPQQAPAPAYNQYQGSGYPQATAPTAPPPETQGYMEKPPPYN